MAFMGNETLRIPRSPYNSNIGYPVEMNEDRLELVQFMHSEYQVTKLRVAFRPVWFGLFMKDAASFLQLMSTATLHRGFTRGVNHEDKATQYRQLAWKSVADRLLDPATSATDGVMSAVLAFLILDHWLQDRERYLLDKAALVRMVDARGGILKVEDNAELRLVMLWDDVGGATSFDIQPSFGLPTRHLPPLPAKSPIPPSPRLLHILSTLYLHQHPPPILLSSTSTPAPSPIPPTRRSQTTTTLLHDIFILNSMTMTQIPSLYDDPLFLGLQINPIIIRLLGKLHPASPVTDIERALCLAAVLYLGDIRVLFCSYHTTGYHFVTQLVATLKRIKAQSLPDAHASTSSRSTTQGPWRDQHPLHLWILTIGALKASAEDLPFFVSEIKLMMSELQLQTWNQVLDIVVDVLWIEDIYGVSGRNLGASILEAERV